MKRNQCWNVCLLSVAAALLALSFPSQAQAWWGKDHHHRGHGYPHYDRYPYGKYEVSLPHSAVTIGFGGHRYFYHTGFFYTQSATQYVVVPPPTGIVVYQIPDGWHQVVIDGVMYYTYNGVYYSRIPQGYQVVQPPAPVVVEPAMVSAQAVVSAPTKEVQQEFTVNIPDNKGGYVSVLIKRTGKGFSGPQGEFYEEFPKVVQLQAMYVK